MEEKKGIHRAWIVMLGCCCLVASLALITTCMSFFVKPVSEALGFERGAFTVYYSLAALVGVVAMPIWGRVIPKLGIRLSVAIAGAGGALFMVLFSLCRTLIAFYICGLLMGIMIAGMTLLPASILINTWFEAKRGLAMGIVMACSGVGGAIFSPILQRIIVDHGWQAGYVANGLAIAILTIPPAIFLLRGKPSDVGLQPYGAAVGTADAPVEKKPMSGVPANVATKSMPFILLAVAVVLMNIVASLIQHLPAHFVSMGVDPTAAAGIISIYMLVVIGAKVLLGFVNDHFGVVAALGTTFALWAASFVVLALTKGFGFAITGAVLFGLGVSVVTVIPPLLTGTMFGQKDFSAIYAIIGAMGSLGLAIGTPVVGLAYDKTGSYYLAFFGSIAVLVVAMVLLVTALRGAKRLPVA